MNATRKKLKSAMAKLDKDLDWVSRRLELGYIDCEEQSSMLSLIIASYSDVTSAKNAVQYERSKAKLEQAATD